MVIARVLGTPHGPRGDRERSLLISRECRMRALIVNAVGTRFKTGRGARPRMKHPGAPLGDDARREASAVPRTNQLLDQRALPAVVESFKLFGEGDE